MTTIYINYHYMGMWSETDDRFKEDYTGMLIENFKNYMKEE